RRGRDRHAQDRRAVVGQVLGERLDGLVAEFLRLDDHPFAVAVPGERDRADPEVLHQRLLERTVVGERLRSRRRNRGRSPGSPQHFVQQFIQPLGELTDLALFERDAGDPAATGGLQVEGALARLADGSGNEPVRRVVRVDRHRTYPPAPPPTGASPGGRAAVPAVFLSDLISVATLPPVSFCRSTNGRSGVKRMTVSEQGSMLIRWYISRCRPRLSARMALITSPCEQIRYVAP